jgi:DNA transposition AAA+ family ATPase
MTPSLSIKPIFVKSANVRNFEAMMKGLELSAGEGRFGLVWGRAGRGKTRTAQYFVANNQNCHYVLALKIWRHSQGEFLRALAREMGMSSVPGRIGPLFTEVAERMARTKPFVFVDEPEKLSSGYLEILRDLTEATTAPIVLIGEEDLPGMMRKERRVWSRTYQQVQFRPFGVADIVNYVTAAAGIRFTTPAAADAMFKSSEGDIRIVRRDLINLVQVLNAKGTAEADENAVKAAIRHALTETDGN